MRRLGVAADADRARQRLERHPRTRDAWRTCGRATPPSSRSTRSPCIRSPRTRAAPRASRCRRATSAHDLPAMRAAITPKTRIVFVANPNNPTGTWIAAGGAARRSSRRCRATCSSCSTRRTTSTSTRRTARDSVGWIAKYPNLLVSRSFSKAYGLAALRIGYGVMHADVADMLNRVRQPFNVNALAQAAAIAALADDAYVDESRALNRAGWRSSTPGFDALGIAYVPSHGNFVLAKVGDAARVNQRAAAAGRHRAAGRELRPARVPARDGRTARRERPVPGGAQGRARALTAQSRGVRARAQLPRSPLPRGPEVRIRQARRRRRRPHRRLVRARAAARGRGRRDRRRRPHAGQSRRRDRARRRRPRVPARRGLDARTARRRRRAGRGTGRAVPGAVRRDGARRGPADRDHRRRQHEAGRDRRGARRVRRRAGRASSPGIRSPAPSTPAPPRRSPTLFDGRNVILTPLRRDRARGHDARSRRCGRRAARA